MNRANSFKVLGSLESLNRMQLSEYWIDNKKKRGRILNPLGPVT